MSFLNFRLSICLFSRASTYRYRVYTFAGQRYVRLLMLPTAVSVDDRGPWQRQRCAVMHVHPQRSGTGTLDVDVA